MEDLKKFFEDVKSIRNSLELLVKEVKVPEINISEQNKQEMIKQMATAPVVPVANIPTQPVVVPATAPMPQMPVGVPVSQNVENFTQEQIAVAMANATQIGRSDVIQNIFKTFNVNTLMEVNPANYNQIATMLREAGIQI